MRKDKNGTQEPKAKYRVRNWAAYNAGLINRGNITMWIGDDALANMPDTEPTRGRSRLYSDALIQALLGLKTVFHLPLRALQGFAQSLRDLAFAELPVPNYTTVCRRAQALQVKLPVIHSDEPLHLVVDSTGAKVCGEGEWKVRQHGYSKRRTWRKVHLALDANTGQLRAALMTHQDVADGEVLPELLEQISADESIDTIGGDGAYDTQACYASITARGALPSIPPREGAVHWPTTTPGASRRNAALDAIAQGSRREWKQQSGYHRRSLAENAMYRLKTLTGPCLWARRTDTQATEVAVRVGVLNRMAELSRPQSVRIARDHEQRHHFVLTPDLCNNVHSSAERRQGRVSCAMHATI
ncbi:transposase DDE domain protein [Burkholderia thailandensis USAMRU Malaysia |uniref:Transposase n=2 Tax=Burkholderia thailandensis TaxID=57975 RepID=Q2T960_BURTA|nr:IS5 family transposase [Burkholderia thailandensis]ABC35760.1 transposase [Burkholderia thailandensis E264]AHI75193.1 transposase DDE domain protein [Burkholderia thailandensis 2002721723]AHI82671.1 transposase DDE domain protein [Burkholderia thailandensis E444]AIC90066.1 transposase DDE domain protein [Burkholderia thailandensis USAMRU Malaysia \